MGNTLLAVGYFVSDKGGARNYAVIREHTLVVELITGGAVYDPDDHHLCGPGWIFVHQPGQHTIWRSEPNTYYECLTIHFDHFDHCDQNDRNARTPDSSGQPTAWQRSFLWDPPEDAIAFAQEMLRDFHHQGVDRTIQGALILSQLRYRMERFTHKSAPTNFPPRIARAMTYLDHHFERDIAIETLADYVNLSASHLHASFKDCLGISPHQYIIQQRMRSARHRLVTSSASIGDIARAVGYPNPESFCRAFRRAHHSTAVAYRMRYTRTNVTAEGTSPQA